MKKGITLLLAGILVAQSKSPQTELPIGFTKWEWENRHLIKENIFSTDPPPPPLRHIAEFERMKSVLIRYPLGISTSVVKEMAEDIMVYVLVDASQQSSAYSTFSNAGVNMNHVDFIAGPTDSYWTRDYGPWWILNGEREIGIVDFTYNRPRPNDDEAPSKVATHLNVPYYSAGVVHAGGNFMTDGYEIGASTTLVYDENELTQTEIHAIMRDYFGINTYHVVDDPNGEYIEHIDCWGKFLSPTKLLLREVSATHSQYDEIEAVVDYFENQTTSFGEPWEIYRVYTPNNEPYSNTFILNNKVFFPQMNSQWDDDAIAIYQSALPGYEILPFTGSWLSTDAIHCRAIGIPDLDMLQIFHNPLNDQNDPNVPHEIHATIDDLSEAGLIADQLTVYWKTTDMPDYQSIVLSPAGDGDEYSCSIPAPFAHTEIQYYIHAADSSGREENLPIAGYFSFQVSGSLMGDVNLDSAINILDVIAIVQHILGNSLLEGESAELADLNHDLLIDIFDIVKLVDAIISP